MGIISWIKNKYYDNRYQKAVDFSNNGKTGEAIEVLESILEYHPKASRTLLGIYHSQIQRGDKNAVFQVAKLYESYNVLKSDCLNFIRNAKILNPSLYIDYCQALYCKGITELESYFVNASVEYVRKISSSSGLKSLSNSTTLLTILSETLLVKADILYRKKSLEESKQLCLLIAPYLSNQNFYELYVNVRFDIIIGKEIGNNSILELDSVFDYANKHLVPKTKTVFFLKCIELAKELYKDKKYVPSLLISQRFACQYADAKKIYSDSALKLYTLSPKDASLVDSEFLYSSLGDGLAFISALEPFIPYSTYREKYITVVEKELLLLAQKDRVAAETLFTRAWGFAPSGKFIKAVLSAGTQISKREFVKIIIASNDMLASRENLETFVDELIKMDFSEFVVSSLEQLLDKGKDVSSQYERQILLMARHAVPKSRDRIDIIKRAFKRIKTDKLYSVEISYLNDYIENGNYDSQFALSIAEALVGKQRLAEVLIAKISVDDSVKSKNKVTKEEKLRRALSFYKVHNLLFDSNAYKYLLPRIEKNIIRLAKSIYSLDKSRAIALLYLLRDNDLSWFDTYAKLYLDSIQTEAESEELANQILSIINEGKQRVSIAQNELWRKFVSVKILVYEKETDNTIEQLKALLVFVDSQCVSSNKQECEKEVGKKLSKHLRERALTEEAKQLYDEAIKDYEYILELSGNYKDVKERILICKLKSEKILPEDKVQISNLLSFKKDKPYQRDLAYRWCLYLLALGDIEKVETINADILDSDSEISQICQDRKINLCQKKLDVLNEKISKLNNSELSPEEAISLGQELSKKIEEVQNIVQISVQKANAIKEAIRLYAIEKFYKQGEALKCFNGLKVQDSTYLAEPIALRNLAVMSLGAAENGQISNENYKELLATWATAIYQQDIFVKSLNFTSWDDQYTFSLHSALGCLGKMEEKKLPDNVNYDTFLDNNVVSILEVQKTLITRMEIAIGNNSEYMSFFSTQLEAMDMLASQNLGQDSVVVAPYLTAISDIYMKCIAEALTNEANQHNNNWETILKIGVLYGLKTGDFYRYSSAVEVLNKVISAIRSKCNIGRAFGQISVLLEFAGLYADMISTVMTCMNSDIAKEINYREFYLLYKIPVLKVNDDMLSFTYSNYINQQAVKNLNEKTETLAEVSPLLFELYDFCKCNPHLKRNVENIVEALIHNYITEGDSLNLTVLDKVLSSTRNFDTLVVKALKGNDEVSEDMMILLFSSNDERFSQLKSYIGKKSSVIQRQFDDTLAKVSEMKIQLELSQIVADVNDNTLSKCTALQKVYKLYEKDKNNVRICQNLATLIPMCVMEYIIADKRGRLTVETVLDALKYNMSMTFRSYNSGIGQAYNMVWSQLPYSAQSAITNSPWTLNEQGEKLKKGLDYLKALR